MKVGKNGENWGKAVPNRAQGDLCQCHTRVCPSRAKGTPGCPQPCQSPALAVPGSAKPNPGVSPEPCQATAQPCQSHARPPHNRARAAPNPRQLLSPPPAARLACPQLGTSWGHPRARWHRGVPGYAGGFQGISRNLREFQGIPADCRDWEFTGVSGIGNSGRAVPGMSPRLGGN